MPGAAPIQEYLNLCGIVGFTHKNWSPGADRIQSAVDTLLHRGPDQQGVFESNVVSLGATRLKIIDLASGNQPIKSDNGDAVIVFNGEIYNHAEVRVELEKIGHRFHSRSDTETVLHAFMEWDTDCFSRLRGMFGVALWTESKQRLVLARDRMGIKPLYFTRRGKDLFFGSELKAILIHPEIERRLSMEGLDCYLSLNYVPCPWTLVDGIEKLSPGYWLEWRNGEVRSEPYWTLPFVTPHERTFDSAKEELDHLLREAVREHLLSDVPLGVWLSGGIDSSTILHYAAEASSSRLKTLSISFRGRSFDESSYIQQVAAQYGTDHQQFDLNTDADLAGAIEEFAYYSDEPTADAGALPVWFLSKMSKTKVTVTLSGEGADEVFGGYLTYRANEFARRMKRVPSNAIRLALVGVRHWPVSDEKIGFEYKVKRFLEGCLMPADQAHVYWNGTFSAVQKSALLRSRLPDALDRTLGGLRERSLGGDGVSPYLWFDQKYFLPDDILMKVDRMSMAHAVEVRPPFLDHRIVEFAASLPASFKIRGSRQKYILRELMRGKLPGSILQKKKTGLDIPSHEWLRGPLRPLMLDALGSGAAEHAGLFEKSAIDACVSDHLERRANLGYHLWGLMILFLWMRKWRIQTEPVSLLGQKVAERVLTST
jgi:asparagine synthase (glutamine-hydrolysing)